MPIKFEEVSLEKFYDEVLAKTIYSQDILKKALKFVDDDEPEENGDLWERYARIFQFEPSGEVRVKYPNHEEELKQRIHEIVDFRELLREEVKESV